MNNYYRTYGNSSWMLTPIPSLDRLPSISSQYENNIEYFSKNWYLACERWNDLPEFECVLRRKDSSVPMYLIPDDEFEKMPQLDKRAMPTFVERSDHLPININSVYLYMSEKFYEIITEEDFYVIPHFSNKIYVNFEGVKFTYRLFYIKTPERLYKDWIKHYFDIEGEYDFYMKDNYDFFTIDGAYFISDRLHKRLKKEDLPEYNSSLYKNSGSGNKIIHPPKKEV